MSHRPEILRRSLFRRSSLSNHQAFFIAGTSLHPPSTMDPGSPSYHASEVEEEDSPLQQSAHTSHPPPTDSYLEDVTYEAEEEQTGQAAEEMVE
jgi:hypothetical protein